MRSCLHHLLPLLLLLGAVVGSTKAEPEPRLAGLFWSPDKDAKIEFYRRGGKVCGKIVWLEHPGRDINNSDPQLRSRPLLELELIRDFIPGESGTWAGGTVYDPDTGNTYQGRIWLGGDHRDRLFLRGYVGFSLFGRTEVLERVRPDRVQPAPK
jgi:uncharacterized protein (DUF2147 family)